MTDKAPPAKDTENPHQSWEFQDEAYLADVAPPPGFRPGSLTAVCVIAIILGALAGFGSLAGLLGSLAGGQLQQMQSQWGTAGTPKEMRDLQAEMNGKMMQIANRYRLVNLGLSALQIGVATALIFGGVRTLQLKASGRKLLRTACACVLAYELLRAIPTAMIQMENMTVMVDYMPRVMEASVPSGQGDQIAQFGSMFTKFMQIVTWVMFAGWLLLKVSYYGVSIYYLGRPRTRNLCAAE